MGFLSPEARSLVINAPIVAPVVVPDSARVCRIWVRNGSGPGFSVVTNNIVSVSNTVVLQYDFYSQVLYKMHAR